MGGEPRSTCGQSSPARLRLGKTVDFPEPGMSTSMFPYTLYSLSAMAFASNFKLRLGSPLCELLSHRDQQNQEGEKSSMVGSVGLKCE